MYSKEALLNNSTMAKIRSRHGKTTPVKGVLSKEEVELIDILNGDVDDQTKD